MARSWWTLDLSRKELDRRRSAAVEVYLKAKTRKREVIAWARVCEIDEEIQRRLRGEVNALKLAA